jgi:hypothetical protein
MTVSPLSNVIVPMQFWPAEEVSEGVLHSRSVSGADGEVVAQGDGVELAEKASES